MARTYMQVGLGKLPGRKYDKTPRLLRDSFLKGQVDPEKFVKENFYGLPKTRAARFENKIKSYATVSIVIERYWKFVQEQNFAPVLAELKGKHGTGPHIERVRNFLAILLALLNNARDKFVDDAMKRSKSGEGRSHEDKLLMCFWAVARKRHRHLKGLPFPSLNDLVVFFGRLAGVAPAVFVRDVGREPTEEEYFGLLRHPYMLRLCVEIMRNDRKSTHPLFAKLEGVKKGDLNDVERLFVPELFEIRNENGLRSMRIKPMVMAEYCKHYAKAAMRRKKCNKPSPRVLGCPALYTGQFRNMYEWVTEKFEVWYTNQPPRET